ncbi:peptide/nickel transport system substrate-binding protein [Arthrobacter sp. yr096]|uniref:ABC transporter substrate-binding protein n=1 Tax=Arthrobacter sp. yr096 TaxID=1761750 RepID=UPI0008AFCF2D|nr:ABC transporter substrate-binding protein [Arthrobacter sp. yr096]SEI92531.1 peptide/nickel transport system substrate-binding protein [Arthrobacter sp. yr096]
MNKKLIPCAAIFAAGALALSSCGSSPGETASSGKIVTDGTLKFTGTTDPGNLFPLVNPSSDGKQVMAFGYDSLISLDRDGKLRPYLAESWTATTTEASFTLKSGITCNDGSELTAQTVADNFTWITDEKNNSSELGATVPEDLKATADNATRRVTLTSTTPSPFLIENVGRVSIACSAALKDPSKFAGAFGGTGLYNLTDVKPGESYTMTRRSGYSWGPEGTTSETPGLPKSVVITVVNDNTTRANLLASGSTNAAYVTGADARRLNALNMKGLSIQLAPSELFFNQRSSRVNSDPAVKKALVQSTNTSEIIDILAGGKGSPAQSLLIGGEPRICTLDDVYKSIPAFDVNAAAKTLDDAGWKMSDDGVRSKDDQKLAITFVYRAGAEKDAAFEHQADVWKKLGVAVTLKSADAPTIIDMLFTPGSSDWDVADMNVSNYFPSVLVPYFSGETSNNFSNIQNPTYNKNVAAAMKTVGVAGCPEWQAAERALVSDADVLPLGWTENTVFIQGFTASQSGVIDPWSIRLSE